MTTRKLSVLAAALALPLALTACGGAEKAKQAGDLSTDNNAAKEALQNAKSAGFTLRFNDPDGALRRALEKPADPSDAVPASVADALVKGSITIRVDGAGEAKAFDFSALRGKSTAEQLQAGNVEIVVRGGDADLLQLRIVEGTAYATSDVNKLDEMIKADGGGKGIQEGLQGAPPAIRTAVNDMRAGKWVKLPITPYIAKLEQLGQQLQQQSGASPSATPDPAELLDKLLASVQPHVRLADLGKSGDVRTATVKVNVKEALTALTKTSSSLFGGAVPGAGSTDKLFAGLADTPVEGKLTIDDGHYTSLEVGMAQLVELDKTPSAETPDFGASSLLLDIDDDAGAVDAPDDLSSADIASLVDQFFSAFEQRAAQRPAA